MRAVMTRHYWRKFRIALLEKQGPVCSSCGKEESETRRVLAHEEWEYDESTEPAIARIIGVSLVCWHCHACEHWGNTTRMVRAGILTTKAIDDTIAHFCRLNGTTKASFKAHCAEAEQDWIRRSQRKWRIDYGIFTEWTATTFERDPLNNEPWSPAISSIRDRATQVNHRDYWPRVLRGEDSKTFSPALVLLPIKLKPARSRFWASRS